MSTKPSFKPSLKVIPEKNFTIELVSISTELPMVPAQVIITAPHETQERCWNILDALNKDKLFRREGNTSTKITLFPYEGYGTDVVYSIGMAALYMALYKKGVEDFWEMGKDDHLRAVKPQNDFETDDTYNALFSSEAFNYLLESYLKSHVNKKLNSLISCYDFNRPAWDMKILELPMSMMLDVEATHKANIKPHLVWQSNTYEGMIYETKNWVHGGEVLNKAREESRKKLLLKVTKFLESVKGDQDIWGKYKEFKTLCFDIEAFMAQEQPHIINFDKNRYDEIVRTARVILSS